MANERIVFMGTPDFAANILECLIKNDYNLVGVVTQCDKKVGRKQQLTYSPVKEVAIKYHIPLFQPAKIKDDYQAVLDFEPDLILTAAYGQIIPKALLDYPHYHCINTHGSLLPKYRGGSPIQTALINGETYTGMTLMFMEEKMDAGDILRQEKLLITDEDTNATLFKKLSDLAAKMLLEFLPAYFAGSYESRKQNIEEVTYSYNLKKEDEFIHFDRPVRTVFNHIRGLLDNPGAFGILNGRSYKFLKVAYAEDNGCGPDSVFLGLEADYLKIACLDGYIKVYSIKPEGKNAMDARSFYNGAGRSLVGSQFAKEF